MPVREPGKPKLSGMDLVRSQQHALTVPADKLPALTPGMAARAKAEALPEGITTEDAELSERMAMVLNNNCQIYTPSPFAVCGEIRNKYNAMGGPASFLGLPNSPEYQNPGATGYRSEFFHGSIYWSPATGAHPVTPLYMTRWSELGWEAGWMGYPTTDEFRNLDNVGSRQEFQGAAMYWHPLHSPLLGVIGGAIRDKWNTVGAENGPLGYPNSIELGVIKNNGRYNNFSNGTITWSVPTGARLLYAPIRDRWAAMGREDGELGYPTSDENVAPDGTGHYAAFETGGSIYWYPVLGAWFVPSKILGVWALLSYEAGRLGYPIAGPEVIGPTAGTGGYLRQKFDKGFAIVGPDGKAFALSD